LAAEDALSAISERVVVCRKCPRLVRYRESVRARRAFAGQIYWRKPVPGFGDPMATVVVVGLAPAAHGGERTGRVFTGDESARFLYRSLFDAGLSNQPTSESADDGLVLLSCYITAAVKCAPPEDKPTPRSSGTAASTLTRSSGRFSARGPSSPWEGSPSVPWSAGRKGREPTRLAWPSPMEPRSGCRAFPRSTPATIPARGTPTPGP